MAQAQLITFPLSTTGTKLSSIVSGQRHRLLIENAGGSTFDLRAYVVSLAEATRLSITRTFVTLIAASTATQTDTLLDVGYAELEIEITAATATRFDATIVPVKVTN